MDSQRLPVTWTIIARTSTQILLTFHSIPQTKKSFLKKFFKSLNTYDLWLVSVQLVTVVDITSFSFSEKWRQQKHYAAQIIFSKIEAGQVLQQNDIFKTRFSVIRNKFTISKKKERSLIYN